MKQALKSRLTTAALLAVCAGVSTGLACPAKKGYMFNGSVPQRAYSGINSVCGSAYTTAVKQIRENFRQAGHPLPANVWIEIYSTQGFDSLGDWSDMFVTMQKNRGLELDAEWDVPSGAATLYKNYANGRTLIEYQFFYATTKQMYTWLVYIGN